MSGLKKSTAMLALLAIASTTAYSDETKAFYLNIKAQQLTEALREFSDKTNIQLIYSQAQLEGIKTTGATGSYASTIALGKLLKSTNLTFYQVDKTTYAIRPRSVGDEGFQKISYKDSENYESNLAVYEEDESLNGFGGRQLDEIVVTAQKRSQNLQDVPISITALNNETLERSGITQLNDIAKQTPNFAFDQSFGAAAAARITIRGISTNVRNPGFESGTSIYVDGVYAGRPQSSNLNLQNIERVEVLKGPQGTLFGKNTIAGAVNVITKKPGNEIEGSLGVNVGNLNRLNFSGYVSGPLVEDKAFIGASFHRNKRDGTVLNLFDNTKLGEENNYGGDIKLRFLPSDATEINFRAHYNKDDTLFVFPEYIDGAGRTSPTVFAPGIRTTNLDVAPVDITETYGLAMMVDYQLANEHILSSITAYQHSTNFHGEDNDNSPLDFAYTKAWDTTIQHASQEFRLTSPASEKFDYVLGAYLFWQHIDSSRPFVAGADFPPFGPDNAVTPVVDLKTKSIAFFAHSNYNLTEKLTITAGLRYTIEQKEVLDYHINVEGSWGLIFGFNKITGKRTDKAFSPMGSISYAITEDSNIYAKIARGFKSGGWNVDYITGAPTLDELAFNPEFATTYEIGFKNTFLDNRLLLNMAVFQTKYNDLQVTQTVITGEITRRDTTNAGKATINGFEVETTFVVSESLQLRAGLGYTDATFDSFKDGGGIGIDYDGNTLDYAPQWNGTVAVDFEQPISDFGRLLVSLDYSYKGSFYTDSANDPTVYVDGHSTLGGQIGFITADDRWEAFLWMRNIANSDAINSKWGFIGRPTATYVLPRTYGLKINYNF